MGINRLYNLADQVLRCFFPICSNRTMNDEIVNATKEISGSYNVEEEFQYFRYGQIFC